MTNSPGQNPAPDRSSSRARVDAERVLNAAFDGTLDAAGHMQFAELLRTDPKFRARWAHTARTLTRLRSESPPLEFPDRTDAILARVDEVRGFSAPAARRPSPALRGALAAGLAVALIGVGWFIRGRVPVPSPAERQSVVASDNPRSTGAPAPAGVPRSAKPVTTPPVLSMGSTDRYDRDIDLKVRSRVDSPSGGPSTMRVFSAADGRVLLTDFEPYPHATTWRDDSEAEKSWWIRAWTRPEPAWAGAVPAGK